MVKYTFYTVALLCVITTGRAQEVTSTSDYFKAQSQADRVVSYDVTAPGISKTVAFGADLAWANEQNFRRVILFGGLDQLDIVRASFQPTYPLINGTELTREQMNDLNWRLHLINTYAGENVDLALNCDHPWVDEWYVGNPANWEALIQATAQKFLDAGHRVVTVGAFNEPDYGWGQGSIQDMYAINQRMSNNPFFDDIRLSGGNTLNCDQALDWYNYLVPAGVNEGNTHQLAGDFDGFANFFETVRANGHHATADEMHNVVEALVGYEYGMQTGIWWGPAELARGELVKAFDGERIGYAEHRPNWTAAAVYRTPEGKVKAFGGTSERQAATTTYKFISRDRPVFYDGHGPQHEYVLEIPGGTGYQQGQTNAERVINITWGDDIQPVINGSYVLVNRGSGLVMSMNGTSAGSNVQLANPNGAVTQQWLVTPVDARIGGDFSYYQIKPLTHGEVSLDLVNFSLEAGANIQLWTAGGGGNQQWYLDYAEDGWFYIRSRESTQCIQVSGAGGNIVQGPINDSFNQQWRFLPLDAPVEFQSPYANGGLEATPQSESVVLTWVANPETDIAGYTVFRSLTSGGPYQTIARNVSTTTFVDNTALSGTEYFYAIKAVDFSLNSSGYSNEVTAGPTGDKDIVAHYSFDGNLGDSSIHLNHGASYGEMAYVSGKVGAGALVLNASESIVQLPPYLANHSAISITTWVKWNGGLEGQRIFDFGNDHSEYMMLTPSISSKMSFVISYDDTEVALDAPELPVGEWAHVAVTMGGGYAYLYVNGEPVDVAVNFTKSPLDFRPVLNYLGRGQSNAPLFDGVIDDFRLYNYAMDPDEVAAIADTTVSTTLGGRNEVQVYTVWPNPVSESINISYVESGNPAQVILYTFSGKQVLSRSLRANAALDVSHLPNGLYLLRVDSGEQVLTQKILVQH